MKEYIKKYWLGLLIILITPLVVNTIMVQPVLFPITGDDSAWLGFWGSYIGALLSSAIALYVLYRQNQQNHIENTSNRNLQLSVIKYNQELDKLRDLRDALVNFQTSFDYIGINDIASRFIDGYFGEKERMRLKYLVRDIDEKGFKACILLDLMPKSDSVNSFNLLYNKLYNSYGLILSDFSAFLDLMQGLPQNKKDIKEYVEKHLNCWNTYDEQPEQKEINKIRGFTPQKSISSIIQSHGNFENIEKESPKIVKERLAETLRDSSLKEKLKICIKNILTEEQNRIYNILSNN